MIEVEPPSDVEVCRSVREVGVAFAI